MRMMWPRKINLSHPYTLSKFFTDLSKAVLLLWFYVSVIVCLCVYVLVKFLFWIAVGPIFGKETVLLASCLKCLIVMLLLFMRPSFPLVSWMDGVK